MGEIVKELRGGDDGLRYWLRSRKKDFSCSTSISKPRPARDWARRTRPDGPDCIANLVLRHYRKEIPAFWSSQQVHQAAE
jgi:hypothetical protein